MVQTIYANDYYSYNKELKMYEESGGKIPIINSVLLVQRLHGHSVDGAKSWLRDRAVEMEAEYLRRKNHFLECDRSVEVSPAVLRYLDHNEQFATGQVIWLMYSYRHNAPGGEGYRQYFAKRVKEGAVFFDDCTESKEILTGGHTVLVDKSVRVLSLSRGAWAFIRNLLSPTNFPFCLALCLGALGLSSSRWSLPCQINHNGQV